MKVMSGCRVFIGHLSNRASEYDVKRFFEGFGKIVEVSLKTGYGFVEFEDSRDADDAVYELNNRSLCGQRITVEIAKGVKRDRSSYRGTSAKNYGRSSDRYTSDYGRKEESSSGYYNQSNDRYGEGEKYRKLSPSSQRKYRVIVENLSSKCNGQDLKNYLMEGGEITYVEAHKRVKNEGFADFTTYSDMKTAIEKLDNTEFFGRKIHLIEDRSRSYSRSRSRSPHHFISRARSRDRNQSYSRSRSPKTPKTRY